MIFGVDLRKATCTWVGRATVFLVGLAMILALVFGVVSTAMGANGDPFILGKAANTATRMTGRLGNIADTAKAALSISNTKGGWRSSSRWEVRRCRQTTWRR